MHQMVMLLSPHTLVPTSVVMPVAFLMASILTRGEVVRPQGGARAQPGDAVLLLDEALALEEGRAADLVAVSMGRLRAMTPRFLSGSGMRHHPRRKALRREAAVAASHSDS